MTKQSIQTIKMGLMAISLFALVACSSTSDTEEGAMDGEASSSSGSSNNGSARTNPGSTSGQLTQEEIRAQNALRQTVFYFDFDIAEFKPADRETLSFHARDLAANSRKRIRLEGHGDERGTREYNLALGERRANSVLNYLIVNGASRSQIEVVSYGEERPQNPAHNSGAWAENRRAVLEYR